MVSSQDEPLFLHDDDEIIQSEYSKGFLENPDCR